MRLKVDPNATDRDPVLSNTLWCGPWVWGAGLELALEAGYLAVVQPEGVSLLLDELATLRGALTAPPS